MKKSGAEIVLYPITAPEKTSFLMTLPGALPRRCGAPNAIVTYYPDKDFR